MRWADCSPLWRALPLREGAVAVPGGDTAQQDALNCASVKVPGGLRSQTEFLQPPEVEETLLRLLVWTTLSVWTISDRQ